jgi:GAF domain-containing protein
VKAGPPDHVFELADLCAALAAAVTAADVARLVANHGRSVLGAAHTDLYVVDRDRQALESLVVVALPSNELPSNTELASNTEPRYRHVALDAGLPVADAVRRNAPIWPGVAPIWPDNTMALGDGNPGAARDTATGDGTIAALPLRSSSGKPIGVIEMSWHAPVTLGPADRVMMMTVAGVTGQALERAMLAERAGRVARRHQAIATLAQRIAGERGLDSILNVVTAEVGPIMEAPFADVTLAEPAGLRVFGTTGRGDMANAATSIRLPMTDAASRVFGSLGFGWRTTRDLDGDDMAVLTTLTELVSRTVERTRTETTTTLRAVALSRLTERLATSVTTAQLAGALAETLPDLLGSQRVVMAAADDIDSLRSAVTTALDGWLANPGDSATGATSLVDAACTAFSEARTLLVSERGDIAAADHIDGLEACAHLPLHDADGRVRGVLCLMWSPPRAIDVATRSMLPTVADLAGQTLERTRLYDSEHATLMALQRRLLGPPPTVDGFDIAVHYEPGDGAVAMGGDWYDTVVRTDGTLVVVVGDVAGHGVPAVASMAQVQYLIAGLIRTNRPLHRIFADVDGMLPADELGYATAQILQLDTRRHRLGYQSAGHPWALLRRPGGRVDRLDGGTCPPIGVSRRPEPLVYTQFTPSTLLLTYTDGLVERRERSIVEGIDRLAVALGEIDPDGDVNLMLRSLVATARNLGGDRLDDDVAAVLIRAAPSSQRAREALALSLGGSSGTARPADAVRQ